MQTYADSVRQLTLAVHPLNAADCAPPSVAEVDYLRRRRAIKQLLNQKTAPRLTLSLGPVLARTRNVVLALVAILQLKRLQVKPIRTISPIAVGLGIGILFSFLSRKRRQARQRTLSGLNAATDDLVNCLYQLLARHSNEGQSVDWGALSRDPESCDGINTMMRKVWRFLEPHASRFLMKQVNRIFANYKPPIFLDLKMVSLQLGARAPEVISMHTFSVSPRSIVLHAQVRLDGDDLYAGLAGGVTGGNVYAGVRNMRLSTLARIELMEPMQEIPFFKAISISFLEPLEPAFSLKLDTGLLDKVKDKVRVESAVKPVLQNILQNEVFGRLCVWPSRLILPMRRRDNPLIKPILPKIQTHIKGILAVVVCRGAGLPIEPDQKSVAALSPDGVNWYKTGTAYGGPTPVWEETASNGQAGELGSHLLLIPLKELDVGLRIAVGLSDLDAHYKWRDRDHPKIVARTTINLHSLAEGEVLEGWHKLRPREARTHDCMSLAADERYGWAPPWKLAARNACPDRPRRLRSQFDEFQRTFCTAFGEPLPPIPRPRQAAALSSYPLPEITRVALGGHPERDAPLRREPESGSDDVSRLPGRSHAVTAGARLRAHTRGAPSASTARSTARRRGDASASGGAAEGAGGAAEAGMATPWGGMYLKLVVLETKTLTALFNETPEACVMRAAPAAATAALADVLRPWQPTAEREGQLCCMFVTVLSAHGLSAWDETSGYGASAYSLGLPASYDTFVKLQLTSGSGAARVVHEEVRTGTIEAKRDPIYVRQFEFLARPSERTMEISVVNTAFVGKGRIQDKTIGVASLCPRALARCPDGRLWRASLDITAPGHPCVITGRVVLSLDWLPLTPARSPPPQLPPELQRPRRGSLFVRLICAWDLAPVDVQAMTCDARVCMVTAGQERRTATQRSMCPVWLTVDRFENVSECGTLWLEVQHATQMGNQSIARCHINVEDLVATPSQAVLITKCLQGWDSNPAHSRRSNVHWTARLRPNPPTTGAASAVPPTASAHASPAAAIAAATVAATAGSPASMSASSGPHLRAYNACDMHGPDALRWAAQHAAEGRGSLASDRAPPDGEASSGWLMFEVAYCPYEDSTGLSTKSRMFKFPRVKQELLAAEARRMHEARQAQLKNALPDMHAPRLARSLGGRKKAAVVGMAGNCLRVEVLRGENMPKMDIVGKSDPYVVLTAQSEAGLQMFRCKTAWKTLNPAWHACMDVWEAHSTGGILEVQVWDDDMLRRDDHIGTECLDVGKTLLAPAPGRRNGHSPPPVAAVPPDLDPAHSMETLAGLPAGSIVSRDVVVELRSARHKQGMPVVHMRLTWVPAGVPPPWGAEREGRPLQPWRHTDLHALQALVGAKDSSRFGDSSHGDSGSLWTTLSHTAGSSSATHGRRGRLSVVVEEAEGGAQASRFPKYVTVRLNTARVGKTRSSLSCSYQHALAPMDNVSADDILVFKFKAKALQGMLLGQATQAVRELVPEPDRERIDVPFRVPLSGSHLALKIRFSWEPVKAYHPDPSPLHVARRAS